MDVPRQPLDGEHGPRNEPEGGDLFCLSYTRAGGRPAIGGPETGREEQNGTRNAE